MQNTILVVDRDLHMQLLLFRLFAEANHAVTSASDYAEAVARIEAEAPDLIVANLHLPDKGGAELARYAKDRPDPIPVILMVPGTDPQPVEPASAVVGIPIDAQKVLEAVRRLLDVSQAQEVKSPDALLIIDDDLGILNLLQNLFANEGYSVTTADCGRAGLAALEHQRPDLILLDVQMPGMDGFEVLSKIRERDAEVPVIMVTGHGSEDVAIQALRLGADDYVSKPLRIRNICFRIETNLERARLRASQRRLNRQLRQTTLELTDRLQEAHRARAAFQQQVGRLLGELRAMLTQAGADAGAVDLADRLRAAAEAEDPLPALAALLAQLEPAKASPDPSPPTGGSA